MTRVLFVIPGLGPGGAERSLAEELPWVVERGIDPIVACFRVGRPGVQGVVQAVAPVHTLGSGRGTHYAMLRRLVQQVQPDLIHTSVMTADLAGRLVGLGTSTPVVTTLVNTAPSRVRLRDPKVNAAAFEAYRVADAATAQICVGFRALTPAVKEASARSLHVARDKISVIPRGRDLKALAFSEERRLHARQRLGISAGAFAVGNVSRQEYQKGLDTLIRAFAVVRRRARHAVLVHAGRSGGYTDTIMRALAEYRLPEDSVRFLGFREDVADSVLPACDVFAFPSRYEGFGGAVLEAAAAGLPIVASDLPALRDVLGKAATFVDSEDVSCWAETLLRSIADGVRPPDRGVTARVEQFDIELVGDQVAAWLHRCADSGRR